ncbi:MAG: phosphotransacetylase family protein [Candidatus Bathyarchaeota archaeon]|nr:MAG: phosphotransacetylase family protein [Candidatus Bathyarchaeota archaeon]
MVYSIYVSGTGFSGKTALCLGLYGKFQEMGLSVGYFKPVGHGEKVVDGKLRDADVILMKEVMALTEPLEVLCPVVLGNRYLDQISDNFEAAAENIQKAYKEVCEGKDILLIESAARPEYLICCGLSMPQLAKELDAKVLFSVKGSDDTVVDEAIHYRDHVRLEGGEMIGVVVNFVPLEQIERMRGIISPILEKCDLDVLGIVPDHRELTLPTVQDVVDVLNAEVLTCADKLEGLVDNYLVGAMSPESALSWLRRSVGKAFITGGDRTDLILTALETKPSAIVLTGNIYPSVRVLSTAEEKGIPILLVPTDTYTTVTRLDLLDGRIVPSPTSTKKIQLTRRIIGEYVDWRKILEGYVEKKKEDKSR